MMEELEGEPQIGVYDPEDEKAKAEFGALYEAIRILIAVDELRPWEDLPPTVQLLFTIMVGSHTRTPNAASAAFMTLVSFMGFLNSQTGEEAAEQTRNFGR
jgi:hypothetical protein